MIYEFDGGSPGRSSVGSFTAALYGIARPKMFKIPNAGGRCVPARIFPFSDQVVAGVPPVAPGNAMLCRIPTGPGISSRPDLGASGDKDRHD